MKIKFKDGTTKDCTGIVEQKAFVSGEAKGWILSGTIKNMQSSDADSIFTDDNISQMILYRENANETEGDSIGIISGYNKITSVAVRYTDDAPMVTFQFSKGYNCGVS